MLITLSALKAVLKLIKTQIILVKIWTSQKLKVWPLTVINWKMCSFNKYRITLYRWIVKSMLVIAVLQKVLPQKITLFKLLQIAQTKLLITLYPQLVEVHIN